MTSMLTVEIPDGYVPERNYIVSLLLTDLLGLPVMIRPSPASDVVITCPNGARLRIADVLFDTPRESWLAPASLPARPLAAWTVPIELNAVTADRRLPVLFGRDLKTRHFYERKNSEISLGLDIFGSCFFMLTRYEESVTKKRDRYGRFPAGESLAFQEGFLDRPIVNEYIEVLWACLKILCPGLGRKERSFRLLPSHDIDVPFLTSPRPFLRRLAGDLLKKRDLRASLTTLSLYAAVKRGAPDPYDCFGTFMDLSERAGTRSAFYFMTGGGSRYDSPRYKMGNQAVQQRIRSIQERGHEIGFHPSYDSVTDLELWNQELKALQNAFRGPIRGGRQHYLRFDIPLTWRFWAQAGLEYDSTLGFSDHAGFRCGICYEYQVFDLGKRETLPLKERPLIAMDCTLTSRNYMNLGAGDEALAHLVMLRKRCALFQGDFTILCHNNSAPEPGMLELYESVLTCGS